MKVKTKTHITVNQIWHEHQISYSVAFKQYVKRHATNHTSKQKRIPTNRKRQDR